jgi:hypothetical protein
MSSLLALHLVAVGIWIGVVAAETFIELDGKEDDRSHIKASRLHYLTDIWVEIPAFTTVLVTGALMLTDEHLHGLVLVKIVCGLIAIVANIVCVYAVFVRNRHAGKQNMVGVQSAERVLLVGGVAFIPSFIAAIAIASYLVNV